MLVVGVVDGVAQSIGVREQISRAVPLKHSYVAERVDHLFDPPLVVVHVLSCRLPFSIYLFRDRCRVVFRIKGEGLFGELCVNCAHAAEFLIVGDLNLEPRGRGQRGEPMSLIVGVDRDRPVTGNNSN